MAKRSSHLTKLDQISMGGGDWRKKKEKRGKKREEEGEERSSTFSLDFLAIGPSVRLGVRGKVRPRIESYAWVPKSVGFVKLREVGVFLLLGLILV